MDDFYRALLRPELSELTAYAPAEPPGIEVRLDANEAPLNPRPAVAEAIGRAIQQVSSQRYPDARARELKGRLAERTGARAEELVVGTGSDEVIALLATTLSRGREPGKVAAFLSPSPTFVMYRVTARAHGLTSIDVPLDAEWDLDVAAMTRAIEANAPNVVFIASPNNPTGNRVAEDRLRAVLEAAKGAVVVLDEAYIDYAANGSLRAWRADYPNLAILRTLSKVGLAALRIGWLEGPERLVREIDKARQPFNVSAISQAAASAVLANAWSDVQAHVQDIVRERARVASELAALSAFTVTPSDANFVWVKSTRPASEVYDALVKRGVLVRSFHGAGGRLTHQLRITIGAPHENDRLLEALRGLGE